LELGQTPRQRKRSEIMGIKWTVIIGIIVLFLIYHLTTNYDTLEDLLKIIYIVAIVVVGYAVIKRL